MVREVGFQFDEKQMNDMLLRNINITQYSLDYFPWSRYVNHQPRNEFSFQALALLSHVTDETIRLIGGDSLIESVFKYRTKAKSARSAMNLESLE